MVTKDESKAIIPSKGSKFFMKSDLPEGLNYEVFCCTVNPTIIAYFTCQKDPWDEPQSILCSKIHIILRLTSRVDFDIDPRGPIYKNVCTRAIAITCTTHLNSQVTQCLSNSWWAAISSVSLALVTTYIFKNQKSKFTTQKYGLKQNSPTTASYIQRPKVTTKMYVIVSLYFIPNLIFKRNGKVSSVMVLL